MQIIIKQLIIQGIKYKAMRKPSQSMYQSNIKAPIATSKVFDGSNLFKSATAIPVHGSTRKIQGQDLVRSTNLPKKNFEQTVNNLKNKPTQKVLQEQYIGGLQQQIKYLEYQLKLLKDKEIIEREGVNELDNFLKDEIPINQNILAMKNKYNSTKSKLEEKYKEISKKISEAEGVLNLQKGEIDRFHKCIDANRKQTANRKAEFKQKLSELVKQLAITRDEYQNLSQQNKQKQEEIKKFNQQLATLQRKHEKQRIQEVRENQMREKNKEKFDEQFRVVKDELVESLQKMDELGAYGEVNPLLQPLEQENSSLRKKLMLNDKQISTAQNIISQIQLHLKQQERERDAERQQKGKIIAQAEIYRTQIQYLERYTQNLIKDQTDRYRNKWLKEMNISLAQKQQIYDLLVDRLRNLEQECSNLIQQKKQLTDSIENEKQIAKQFDAKIQQLQNNIITCRSHTDSLNRLASEIQAEIPSTKGDVQKCKGRIPIVEKQIEKKKASLVHLNKQVDLLKELKTLDLQQLQMISQGGANMQNTLHSFIKSWQKIKTL